MNFFEARQKAIELKTRYKPIAHASWHTPLQDGDDGWTVGLLFANMWEVEQPEPPKKKRLLAWYNSTNDSVIWRPEGTQCNDAWERRPGLDERE